MYSFNIIGNKTHTIVWKHEIIKILAVIKLRITDRIFNNNISKAEHLEYILEDKKFLNMFLNRKPKHAIKGKIPEIEKKRNKLARELNPLEKYEQIMTNKLNQKKMFFPENANFDHGKLFP